MKAPKENSIISISKLFNNAQLQLQKILFYFLLFAFGLTFGVILSFYLKNFSFNLQFAKFSFSALSLHFMKVRIIASIGLKFPFPPAKMHPTRDDYLLVNELNRPEYS